MARAVNAYVFWLLLLCWGVAAQDLPKQPQGVNRDAQPAVKKDSKTVKNAPKIDAQHIEQSSTPDQEAPEDVPPPKPSEQPFSIEQPHTSDPLQALWLGIIGFSCLSTLALGYAAWKLRAAGDARPPTLDSLLEQVNAARQQASRARSRYDELVRRASQPPPSSPRSDPAPPPPYIKEPYESKPAAVRVPAQALPVSPARVTPRPGRSALDWNPPMRPRDELVEAYHQARTSADRNARDQFDNRYPYVRISCINHDGWQFHKNTTLRFQVSDFGWYLMVSRGGNCQAFPWFTQDLAHERESFQGVFEYPEGLGDARLRLVRPALLESEGDGWILTRPGELEVDA